MSDGVVGELRKLCPDLGRVAHLFDLMGIAEAQIELAIEKYPDCAYDLWDMFQYLKPGRLAQVPRLYARHCAELLERVPAGGDLKWPTNAEKLHVMMEMALKSPLVADANALCVRLFRKVFPDEAGRLEGHADPQESYPGGADTVEELLTRTVLKDLEEAGNER